MTPLIATLLSVAFSASSFPPSLAEDEPLYRVHWRLSTGKTGHGEPIPLSMAIAWRDDMIDDPLLAGDEYWIEPVE